MAVVLITGCSSGIGCAAALAFARNGDSVYATMRNLDRAGELQSAADEESLTIALRPLDVGKSETFTGLLDDIVAESGRIDVLVNNAGINVPGALEDLDAAAIRNVMETNCIGPLLLTKAVLPHMRKQNSGLVIMMSSLSGIAGLPGDVAYSASKFALEGATEALRHEVDRWGIRVALVEAGLHATRIFEDAFQGETSLPPNYPMDSPYRPFIERRLDDIRQRLSQATDPTSVAELFVRIADSDRSQLRWPADDLSVRVLGTLLGQDDAARDRFLRDASGCDWWSGSPT